MTDTTRNPDVTNASPWRTGAFVLSESRYGPRTALAPHVHPAAYLCLVVRGAHRETVDARERQCTPSTVVFHPAGERHANEFCAAGGHVFRLEIDEPWLLRVSDSGARLEGAQAFRGGPPAQLASRMFREFQNRDNVSPLMIEALALEFVAAASRTSREPAGRAPEWVTRVRDYLHAHATDDIDLNSVAAAGGVHPAHLARVFRAKEGCSVGEYMRRLRVDIAARQLAASTTPIADIAAATGFADQSHFSRRSVGVARLCGLPELFVLRTNARIEPIAEILRQRGCSNQFEHIGEVLEAVRRADARGELQLDEGLDGDEADIVAASRGRRIGKAHRLRFSVTGIVAADHDVDVDAVFRVSETAAARHALEVAASEPSLFELL
jgi:AraC family transcriptional regulator